MFTGRPEDLAAAEAEVIARLLDEIDALGVGQTSGRIIGAGIEIRRGEQGWTVR
ncbi:hypothetical protein [Streptomyces zaomyceticus]|uniref:hypothetical protein n=1 Tax=Streptomyces zaomyceticus TaxID=68286 RepID=UPI002E139964|nr:hypothetical protein OG237_44085 [Streptomyces zaomyceticus]